MKNLLWIALAAIVLIGGYVLVTGRTPADMIDPTGNEVDAPVAPDNTIADEPQPPAGDVAQDTEITPAETPDEAVTTPGDAAGNVTDDAGEAASDAADGADAAVEDMSREGSDAMQPVDESDAGTAPETETLAPTEPETTAPAADDAAEAGPLSVQNFDMQAAADMIDNSNIDEAQKSLLKTSLQQAQDNPAMLETALKQVRAALDK